MNDAIARGQVSCGNVGTIDRHRPRVQHDYLDSVPVQGGDVPALEGRAQEALIYRVIQENIPQLVNVLRKEQGVQRALGKGSERFVLWRWQTRGSAEKKDMSRTGR